MNRKAGMSLEEFLARQRILAKEAHDEARFTRKQKLDVVCDEMDKLKGEIKKLEEELNQVPAYKRLLELQARHTVLWKERARLRTHKSPLLLELQANNYSGESVKDADQDINSG